MSQEFKIVCAWCEKVLHEPKKSGEDIKISHAMCPECFEKMKEEIEDLRKVINVS